MRATSSTSRVKRLGLNNHYSTKYFHRLVAGFLLEIQRPFEHP